MASAIGRGVLAVGLIVEHLLTVVAVNGINLDFPTGAIVILSASETVRWGIWLEIAELGGGLVGFALAFAVLAVLHVPPPQHTIEDNLSQGRDLPAGIIDLNTVGFSLIEAGGATLWLAVAFRPGLVVGTFTGIDAALVGLAILAVALFVEHNIGVRFSRR